LLTRCLQNKHKEVVSLLKKTVDPTQLMPDAQVAAPRRMSQAPPQVHLSPSRLGLPLPPVPPPTSAVSDARRTNVYAEPGAETTYLAPTPTGNLASYEEAPLPSLTTLPNGASAGLATIPSASNTPIASPPTSPLPMMRRLGSSSPPVIGSPSPPPRPVSSFSSTPAPVPPPRGAHAAQAASPPPSSNYVGPLSELSVELPVPSGSTTLTSGAEADEPAVRKRDSINSDVR
jgi:hypothetical protein